MMLLQLGDRDGHVSQHKGTVVNVNWRERVSDIPKHRFQLRLRLKRTTVASRQDRQKIEQEEGGKIRE